jgi:D-alanine-D-alanine ligase
MDKYKTNTFLKSQGFDVPTNLLISSTDWCTKKDIIIDNCRSLFSFPIVVKPHDDGCSVMVQRATTEHELIQAIDTIFVQNKTHAFLEEYVQGTELTVGVLGNDNPQVLPPSQVVASDGILSIEEKFLPGAGENQTPAPLDKAVLTFVKEIIARVYVALDCKGYARIDCFYQNKKKSPTNQDRLVILEINTLPGLTPATCLFHQAAEVGMQPMYFIDQIVQLGFEMHEKKAILPQKNVLPEVIIRSL